MVRSDTRGPLSPGISAASGGAPLIIYLYHPAVLYVTLVREMRLRHSLRIGLSFGLTSGIITTLGLIVGLHSGTHSKPAVLGGILTIAVADAFSDALGIHVSEESENKHVPRDIWESTVSTLISKFIFALMFVIPVLLLELSSAILVSVILGLLILGVLSFSLARGRKTERWKVVAEHLIIAITVISITHFVGDWVSTTFS